MIKADFFVTSSGDIVGFSFYDHSGFAEEGTDIVCAAVSSASYLVVNTITDVLSVTPKNLVAIDANMKLVIEDKDIKTCRDILTGLKIHLIGLEEEYSDYIRVGYVEV